MNNNWKKISLAFVFPAVLTIVVSAYIYRDLHKGNAVLEPQKGSTEIPAVSLETSQSNQNYTVESVAVPKNSATIPDLSLPVSNLAHIDNAVFKVAVQDIATLEGDLKKDPTDELKWLNLGIFRKIIGDYQVSADIFRYVSVIWPNHYMAFNNLADLYQFSIKNYALAEKNWLKAITIKPDYPDAYENLYNLYIYSYPSKKTEALPILLKGIDNNPKSTDLLVYVARHYKSIGDMANAKIFYNKAIAEAQLEKNSQLEMTLHSELVEISK